MTLARRLAAEGLGTAFLLAGVVGSGIMAETLTADTALALLANTLATGAILIVLIATLGPVSGAHFNPAVTLAFAVRGQIAAGAAAAYILAQLAGALAGVWAAHLMFDMGVFQESLRGRTGPAQAFSEGIATFGLVLFIFLGIRHRPKDVAWIVGLYIVAAYWFTASTSFANPAVTVGRMLTDTFSGIRPNDVPLFLAVQLTGALLAAGTAKWLDAKPSGPAA